MSAGSPGPASSRDRGGRRGRCTRCFSFGRWDSRAAPPAGRKSTAPDMEAAQRLLNRHGRYHHGLYTPDKARRGYAHALGGDARWGTVSSVADRRGPIEKVELGARVI